IFETDEARRARGSRKPHPSSFPNLKPVRSSRLLPSEAQMEWDLGWNHHNNPFITSTGIRTERTT
ncbi:hypothetical protein SESBI_37631, partial [Sesbania bispinosa]